MKYEDKYKPENECTQSTKWFCSSVEECLQGKQDALGSSPGPEVIKHVIKLSSAEHEIYTTDKC